MQLRGPAKGTMIRTRGPAPPADRSLQDIERDLDLPRCRDDRHHPPVAAGPWSRMHPRIALAAVAVLVAVSVLASGCASSSPGLVVSLPVPKIGEVTFYLSLPASPAGLSEAAAKVATPGSSNYRHFSSQAAEH